jgi:hypothetical protein
MTPSEQKTLLAYLKAQNIPFSLSAPRSFTSSVAQGTQKPVIALNDPAQLPDLIKNINAINPTLSVTVIGGGRGGTNNSYSPNNLWEGTDIFIQFAYEPSLTLLSEEQKENNANEQICRVSPNMMLVELNKALYDRGYHCPHLYGVLPFMSLAGGLSTNSHTSFGFLADIVEGIELLLPNGEKKYFKKGSEDFNVCVTSSLGLLGIMTAIDIKVVLGKKKLQRVHSLLTYETFVNKIQQAEQDSIHLNSLSIIFSPIRLNANSSAKLTTWNWVDDETPDQGKSAPQIADDSISVNCCAPFFAMFRPTFLYCFFKLAAVTQQETLVARPDAIMGPESKIAGNITAVELLFDYDKTKVKAFFMHLQTLLGGSEYPVNTAVFIRFPKQSAGTQKVAIDFISFGLNSKKIAPFVNELIGYLNDQEISAHVHYGKNDAVSINSTYVTSENSWKNLKIKYQGFYERHGLNNPLLIKKIEGLQSVHQKEEALMPPEVKNGYQRLGK